MSIRIAHDPARHRFGRYDAKDARLGWTRCGRRFAFGVVSNGWRTVRRCATCWEASA